MLLKTGVSVAHPADGYILVRSPMVEAQLEQQLFSRDFVEILNRSRDPVLALSAVGRTPADGEDFLAFLSEHRMLLEIDPQASILKTECAARILSDDLDYWAETLYVDEFWEGILTDKDCSKWLFAWASENYHYSASVLNHLGTVIEHARTRTIVDRCIRHLREEWDHPRLFANSARLYARAKGITIDLRSAMPLGSTASLGFILRRAARHDLFCYKACIAVLEKTAYRVSETRNYYEQASAFQGLPYEVVSPLVLHAETDETYDHLNSLLDFADVQREVSMDVFRAALRFAHCFADAVYLWQRQMMEIYTRRFPSLPQHAG
jgi:hypothetical protein